MIRRDHFFYDTYEALGSPKLLIGLAAIVIVAILFVSMQLVYPAGLLFGALVAARVMIGRRCPLCDSALKEKTADRDETDAMVLYIVWVCPKDGYEEKEKVRGDSGLFGAK